MNLILYIVSCALISGIVAFVMVKNDWDWKPYVLGLVVMLIFYVLVKLMFN